MASRIHKLWVDVGLNKSSEFWSLLLALTSLIFSIVGFLVLDFSQSRLALIAIAVPLVAALVAAVVKIAYVRKG